MRHLHSEVRLDSKLSEPANGAFQSCHGTLSRSTTPVWRRRALTRKQTSPKLSAPRRLGAALTKLSSQLRSYTQPVPAASSQFSVTEVPVKYFFPSSKGRGEAPGAVRLQHLHAARRRARRHLPGVQLRVPRLPPPPRALHQEELPL